MVAVGSHRKLWVATKGFDFLDGNAVLLTFVPIAFIPCDAGYFRDHVDRIVLRIYKSQSLPW